MGATYADRKALGDWGEQVAADYLHAAGLLILDRNWRCSAGELDIVASDGTVLVGCEVKTRRGRGYGSPIEAITPAKAGRLHRLLRQWASEHNPRCREIRVDVVTVERRQDRAVVEHVRGVV